MTFARRLLTEEQCRCRPCRPWGAADFGEHLVRLIVTNEPAPPHRGRQSSCDVAAAAQIALQAFSRQLSAAPVVMSLRSARADDLSDELANPRYAEFSTCVVVAEDLLAGDQAARVEAEVRDVEARSDAGTTSSSPNR